MSYLPENHTFAICAYKQSAFLENAIQSILDQSALGKVFIATSTPNELISGLAKKYSIPLLVNEHHGSIGEEWNFSYNAAKTPLVTLVHQDDYYEPTFLQNVLDRFNLDAGKMPLISFTDYCEIRSGKTVSGNRLLRIKRFLLLPLRLRCLENKRFFKRLTLRFGNPICCPSITYNKEILGDSIFDTTFKNSLDYLEAVKLANASGAFLYIPKVLMGHRIHKESATTENIADSSRRNEDMKILEQFWPPSVARFVNRFYSKSEESNEV